MEIVNLIKIYYIDYVEYIDTKKMMFSPISQWS